MIFSGNPDGTGSTGVDDAALVWVVKRPDGTSASITFRYDNGCAFISHKPPQNVTSLFKPGVNQVQVKLFDICGVYIGSSSLYLVNTNAPDPPPFTKTPLILIPGIGGSELKVEADTIWRKDLSLTKDLLDQKISQIKTQTGSQKVDIVAHSMGGLVARNYIADATKAQNVRKLFTLGTPHLGAVKFLKALRDGVCLKYAIGSLCPTLASSEVKDVLQNMISGYELAPSQTY